MEIIVKSRMLFLAVNIIVIGFDLQGKYNLRQNLKLFATNVNQYNSESGSWYPLRP
jgi:hypothetical protein